MLKKIIKLLTNNLGLKVVSVLVAIMVWLVVMNLDNPDKTVSFTVPVTVINEDTLEEMGKVYEVYNNTDVATIYVTGKRALIDTLSASDFKATADLGQIDFQNPSDIKTIPITVDAIRYSNDLEINRKTNNMQITIEDLSSERFYISGDPQGIPAEDYAIGEVSVSPNMISVSGPQSLVSKIKRVVAPINVEGVSSDVSDVVVPVLYDENDEVIESTRLKTNQDRVTVKVQMLGTKEVPVKCLTTGEPADGYQFIELEYAPDRIMIKGIPTVLNGISEIVIPGEAIDLTGATGDVENSIDITPYLEQRGVMLRNPDENKIAVKAIVERLETKSIELPVGAIELLNQNEDYEVTFGVSSITIPVRGRGEELTAFTVADVTATLDLAQVEPGDYSLEVDVKVPDPFQVSRTVTVQIHVVDKTAEPEDDDTDQEGSVVPAGPGSGSGGTGSGSGSGGTGNTGGSGNSTGSENNNMENDDDNDEVTGNE